MENNKKNKLKIGIDLDDTTWKFHEHFIDFYNEKFNTNYNLEELNEYSLENFFGKTRKEIYLLIDEFLDQKGTELSLVEGVLDIIEQLNDFCEIFFITSRSQKFDKITLQCFVNHFDKKYPIHFVTDENHNKILTKGELCKKLGIDLMIDDHVKNLNGCIEHNVKCFLFNQKWNNSDNLHEQIIRVNDWNEIFEKINLMQNGN